MTDLELALKQRDEARAELEKVKKSNMHLVVENAELKAKAEKYEEAMKLGDDEITGDALKIGYEIMRNKYNEMIAERDEVLKYIENLKEVIDLQSEVIDKGGLKLVSAQYLQYESDRKQEINQLHKRIKEWEEMYRRVSKENEKYSKELYDSFPTETYNELIHEINEKTKRISELEHTNKVLVDFLNDMEIKFSSYGFFFVANRVPKDKAFEILDIIKPNSDYVKQLKKSTLELVEEQE